MNQSNNNLNLEKNSNKAIKINILYVCIFQILVFGAVMIFENQFFQDTPEMNIPVEETINETQDLIACQATIKDLIES